MSARTIESLESRLLLHGDHAELSPDIDGDGMVNIVDVNLVAGGWGTSNPIANANHDGTVNIFDINAVSANWGQLPHVGDAIKQDEHLAVMALLPRTEATDIAIADGDWDDPAVWYDGTVPQVGEKVLILSDVDLSSDAGQLDWLRVEGELSIRGGTLQAGTIVGTSTSRLETSGGAVGFFGQVSDPYALGVGMVWHGSADIHGTEFSTVAGSPDRGHVMFMHNPDVMVSDSVFADLGRTRKDIPVTDPDGMGNGLENVRGRYALHFHRSGFGQAVQVVNVTVTNPSSWGVVNHESWVNVYDTTVTGAFGAAFVVETGNELGTFTRCTAIDIRGAGRSGQANQDHAEVFHLPVNNDLAFAGHGFWTNSRRVVLDGNYVRNAAAEAYFISASSPTHNDPFTFVNNTADNQAGGALTVWAGGRETNEGIYADKQSLVAHNILRGSIGLGYTGHIDFIDNQVLGPNIAPRSSYGPYTLGVGHTGVSWGNRWIDNTITGWWTGMILGTEGWHEVSGGYYDNLNTDVAVLNTQQNRFREIVMTGLTFGSRALWHVAMAPAFFSYDFSPAYKDYVHADSTPPPSLAPLFSATGLGADSTVTLDGDVLAFAEQGADFDWDLLRYPEHWGKTTADLAAEGLIVGGVPLLAGEQYHLPKVRGVLVGVE